MAVPVSTWCKLGVPGLVFLLTACSPPGNEGGTAAGGSQAGTIEVTPDVVYGHKAGMALTFDVFRPPEANGAGVLFVNSGGFVSGKFRQYESAGGNRVRFTPADSLHLEGETEPIPLLGQVSFAPLLEHGFTVFDVRHGSSPCMKLPEIVTDVRNAVDFIQHHAGEFGIAADRIGLWGGSAGGYLALEAGLGRDVTAAPASAAGASPRRVRAVATFYPAGFDFASDAERFPQLIAGLPALQVGSAVLDSLSLRHLISPDDPPCLIVYGTEDFPFITEPSESLDAALSRAGVPCRRVAIPGVGHEFRNAQGYQAEAGERAAQEVLTWFQEKLAPGEPEDGSR